MGEQHICEDCEGTGFVDFPIVDHPQSQDDVEKEKCEGCNGTGYIEDVDFIFTAKKEG